jgi:hypothetical protein
MNTRRDTRTVDPRPHHLLSFTSYHSSITSVGYKKLTSPNPNPQNKSTKQIQEAERLLALSTTHKTKSQITKAKATKELHRMLSEAFDISLRRGGKLSEEKASTTLDLLSEAVLETTDELEKAQEQEAELEKILWERRYYDYIAAA